MSDPVALLCLIGVAILLVGGAMVIFAAPLGVGFCRMGKTIFRCSPFRESKRIMATVDDAYDEERAPARFRALGIVNLAQGIVMLLIAAAIAVFR